MSRPLHLSRISASYSLGGVPPSHTGVDDAGTAGLAAPSIPSELLAAAAAEEDAEFDRIEEGAMMDAEDEDMHQEDEGEQQQSSMQQPYHTATDIDPYSMTSSSAHPSSFYPSGLLGLSSSNVDENSRDSNHVNGEEAAQEQAEHEDGGRIGEYEEANMQQQPEEETDMNNTDQRFDDAEGWVGSFREQNDDEYQAMQQREAEEQAERNQFSGEMPATSSGRRKRTRDSTDSGSEDDDRADERSYHSDDSENRDGERRSGSDEERRGDRDNQVPGDDQLDTTAEQDEATDATPALYQPPQNQPFLPPNAAAASIYANYAPTTPIAQHRTVGMTSQYASAYPSTPATASHATPMYSAYSPHHSTNYSPSPHFGPTSPRIHSHYYSSSAAIPYGSMSAGASSPRQDTIASVTHRIEYMQRSGRLNQLLNTAARFNQEVAGYTSNAAPIPDYNNLISQTGGVGRSSSKQALISIDQHLLRRYIFNVLDSDMIIRGVVVNKNQNMGLVINIAQILWPADRAREVLAKQLQSAQQTIAQLQGQKDPAEKTSVRPGGTSVHCFPPLSSFLGGIQPNPSTVSQSQSSISAPLSSTSSSDLESIYATELTLFANFEVLAIHGECHLAEIQAPAPVKTGDAAIGLTSAPAASLERFSLGDQVKALVISVDIHSEKVYLSMNQNRLRGTVATMHRLGVIPKDPPPAASPALTATASKSEPLGNASASADSSFASTLSKLKPDLQEKIASFGGALGTAAPAPIPPPSPVSASTPASAAYAGSVNQTSWGYNSFLKSNGNVTPTHPSSSSALLPSHVLKARAALNPKLTASLSLLSNQLLIAKAKSFLAFLHEQPLFKNPEGVHKLTSCYHINQYGSLKSKLILDPANLYKNLRHAQNQAWAKESVVKGISLAKKGSFDNAMKCYKHALDIEPNFTQAYVARGAAYVLQGSLKKAIAEFEQALKIDPQQQYALAYLQAAKEKLMGKASAPVQVASATMPANPSSGSNFAPSAVPPLSSASSSTPAASHSHSRSRDRSSKQDRRHSDEKKSRKRSREERSLSDHRKSSHHSKHRSAQPLVVDLLDSSSSSSTDSSDASQSPSPTAVPSAEVVDLTRGERGERKKEKKAKKDWKKREREKERERKSSSKKHRKKSHKDERRPKSSHDSDKRRGTRDGSSDPSGRSPSRSSEERHRSTSDARTPPFSAGLNTMEDTNQDSADPASAIDDDWFGDRGSVRVLPPPVPQRIEVDSPNMSPRSFTHSDPATPFGGSEPTNPFANSTLNLALPNPTEVALASPHMHLPVSFSSSSLSGFALSPQATADVATLLSPSENNAAESTAGSLADNAATPPAGTVDEDPLLGRPAKRIKLDE